MTLGGVVVIAVTALMAALDGGLSVCAAAAAVGGGSYVAVRRRMNALPDRILKTQTAALEQQLAQEIEAGADEDAIKALQREIKERSESLTKTLETQRWGNKEMAAAVGVASFACPALGLVTLAAVTSDSWLPLTDYLVTAPTPEDPKGYFERNTVLTSSLAAVA